MEVGEFRPGVDLRVCQAHVRLGGVQLVLVVVEIGSVLCFTVGGLGIGAAGDRAVSTDEDLFTLDLGHRDDVNPLKEVRFGGDRVVQLLGDRRIDAELGAD
ncbi:hypothetical protein D3C78_1619690 [compost metagenome]